ncbi:MAG: aminopeptidase P family protein [Trueperaceae bacterium]|nr:aminopeptidase P family protein [Trueperaceae bacterium]
MGAAEYAERARTAYASAQGAAGRGADVIVLFDDQYIQYFTGFVFSPTERPIALVVGPGGERVLFVPRLELEHAEALADVDRVVAYPEYPGEVHPLELLLREVRRLGVGRRAIAVDHDGYPPVMGYAPVRLGELAGVDVVSFSVTLDEQMARKSDHEVALVRESARWGAHAHRLLQAGTKPGLTEDAVVGAACAAATRAMNEAFGVPYRQRNKWVRGALAIYRGQIGPAGAFPHALAHDATFRVGDTLVTGAAADVWGYLSELERTLFLGAPSAEQRHYFDHMLALQDLCFTAIRPGAAAASVDLAMRAYVDEHSLWPHWRHHVGHGLGQRIHESPFLDLGYRGTIEAGMVLSVEPGLYVPGLGGFRHSDTVLVTTSGIELLTDYPRDIASLTIDV